MSGLDTEASDIVSAINNLIRLCQANGAQGTPATSSQPSPPRQESPKTARQSTLLANNLLKVESMAAAPSASRSRVAYIDEADSLAKYSGQEDVLPVKRWTRGVEELAKVCGWSDYETYFAAKRALTAAAADWIQTRSDLRTWKALKSELESAFQLEHDAFQVMERLKKTRAKEGESLVQYVHRMRRLASLANIPEKQTIRHIVNGIPDDPFHKLGLYASHSFDELKDALVVYETAKCEREKTLAVNERPVIVNKTVLAIAEAIDTFVDYVNNMSLKEIVGLIIIFILMYISAALDQHKRKLMMQASTN